MRLTTTLLFGASLICGGAMAQNAPQMSTGASQPGEQSTQQQSEPVEPSGQRGGQQTDAAPPQSARTGAQQAVPAAQDTPQTTGSVTQGGPAAPGTGETRQFATCQSGLSHYRSAYESAYSKHREQAGEIRQLAAVNPYLLQMADGDVVHVGEADKIPEPAESWFTAELKLKDQESRLKEIQGMLDAGREDACMDQLEQMAQAGAETGTAQGGGQRAAE